MFINSASEILWILTPGKHSTGKEFHSLDVKGKKLFAETSSRCNLSE